MSSDVMTGAVSHPLLENYRRLPGAFDEVLLDGAPRAHWASFFSSADHQNPGRLTQRQEAIGRILREHGALYNFYSDMDGENRPWPLDCLPLLIPAEEWVRIERGLVQRARLLNQVLGDIYGPQRLVNEGVIPPALVHGNPAFLHPCHGIVPANGTFLFFHAVDLVRGADGNWRVFSDFTQAPGGAGYVLENRLVVSRVLTEEFRLCEPRRLGGFFQDFHTSLRRLAPGGDDNPKVVLLTAGPHDDGYFEQVFLARYLGLPLVEAGDLTVRGRRVFIKTVEGLQPVHVVLRRVEDSLCDPLELRPESTPGVPGLVEACRAGTVAMANALGSGAVEVPAFLPYLRRLCSHLLGEDLILDSVNTVWCGEGITRECLEAQDRVLKKAFAAPEQSWIETGFKPGEQNRFSRYFEKHPHEYVAQERLAFSTAPVWGGDSIVARPMVARFFLFANGESYQALPGAWTRFSNDPWQLLPGMPGDTGGKDTWVLSDGRGDDAPALRLDPVVSIRVRPASDVPSRVADNLFWLGRYAERIEDTARILRCVLYRLSGETGEGGTAELYALVELMARLDIFPQQFRQKTSLAAVEREVYQLIYQAHRLGTLREVSGRLHHLAFSLRERFSSDTWAILQNLNVHPHFRSGRPQPSETLTVLNGLIKQLAGLSGMEMENMTRGVGWHFLDMGRRLERAINVVTLAENALLMDKNDPDVLAPMLEIADSVMTYRRRYFAAPQWPGVMDLLLLDETNPRSLRFQVDLIGRHAQALPKENATGESLMVRQVEVLQSMMALPDWTTYLSESWPASRPEMGTLVKNCGSVLREVSDAITTLYFSHAETRVN